MQEQPRDPEQNSEVSFLFRKLFRQVGPLFSRFILVPSHPRIGIQLRPCELFRTVSVHTPVRRELFPPGMTAGRNERRDRTRPCTGPD